MKQVIRLFTGFLILLTTITLHASSSSTESSSSAACTYTWGAQTSGTTSLLYSIKSVSNLVAWVGGAAGTVRRTTDGGTTWMNGNPNPGVITGDIYNIEALDGNTAFVTTSPAATFIYKTTNGGTNWTQVYTLAGAFINAVKMTSATNGYAFGDPVGGNWLLLRTTDGGTTWTSLATVAGTGDGRNNCVQIMGSVMWFGTGQNTLWRSTNSGANWTSATTTGITGQVTGIKFNSAAVGLLGGATLTKTTDGGTTFTAVTAPGTGTISGIDGDGVNDFWYVRGTGVYRSTDAGATWNSVYTGTGTQNDIKLAPDGGCLVGWICATGNVAKMSGVPVSCSYNWSAQTSGTTSLLYSVKAVSNLIAWTAGAAGTVRRTTDGGTTWTNANPNPGVITGDIYNIEAIDGNTAWVTTSPAATFIYKTTNGGTNWTQVYTLAGAFLNAIKMTSPTVGIATGDPVGGNWLILGTVDGGNTWTSISTTPGTGDGRNNCLQVMGSTVWFGTGQNTLWRSTNGGVNWTSATTTGITGQVTGIKFNSANVGLLGGATLTKTTDGGLTFTAVTAPGTGTISGIDGDGANDFWYVRGTGVYRSTDAGATWNSVYTGTGTQNDIKLAADPNGCLAGWICATGNVAKMSGQPVGIGNNNNEVPEKYLLQQNYPNPFNPTTSINFSVPTAGFTELKVYDVMGKEVAILYSGFTPAGNHTVKFEASSLSSGVYFYTIKSGSFTDTKKMALIK